MATIRIPDENGRLTEPEAVRTYLAGIGIDYERWEPSHPLMLDAPAEEILAAYSGEIDRVKSRGGYETADVIDVTPETPGLEAMRSEEHTSELQSLAYLVCRLLLEKKKRELHTS